MERLHFEKEGVSVDDGEDRRDGGALRGANHDGDGSETKPLKRSLTERSNKKDLSHEVSSREKPSDWKTWISRLWLMLSKRKATQTRRATQTSLRLLPRWERLTW
jgi:hypothetical protein